MPPRARSGLYFKILMIFAVHIVVLGGILLVGCKDTAKDKAKTDMSTDMAGGPANPGPVSVAPPDMTPPPPSVPQPTPAAPAPAGNNMTQPVAAMPGTVGTVQPTAPVAPPIPAVTGGSVYVIAAGDTLGAIAKKSGVSVKAIEDANPGIDAKKLQIKAKLQIPASSTVASADASKAGADSTAAASGDSSIYIVKTGDTLVKIAKAHNTTVKTIQAMNDMKTAAITAGHKLKVPVMKMASAEAAPAPAALSAPATAPAMPAAPVRAN
jgi:LysM repeat protein